LLLSCLALLTAGLPARAAGFIQPAPVGTNVDAGEILLGELNCVACHTASDTASARLASRSAPLLGADGLRLTPQWLRSWLAAPHTSKPGSAMPDVLHGLTPGQREEAAESLTHFLVTVQPAGEAAGISADPARAEAGRELYHTLGCVACHAPETRPADTSEAVLQQARASAVPLGDLARKYPAGELVRFLRDPLKHRPSGRMPALNLTDSEAVALATYLLRDQIAEANQRQAAAVAGLKWEYYEARFNNCADFEQREPIATGVTDTLNVKMARRGENFAVRFTGAIEIPEDGEYTFRLNTDDGSQLFLDGKLVINNDGDHAPTQKSARVSLTRGPHSFALLFYQAGGGFEFQASWSGPGFQRQEIPAGVLKHFAQPMLPVGQMEFAVDAAKAARGREWFQKLNCAACHPGTDVPATAAKPLTELAASAARGCLAEQVPAAAPKFDLSSAQRTALRATLGTVAVLAQPLTPALQVAHTLTRLNCYACHSREEAGGPTAAGRADWFKVIGEADLGDEGRIPPHLTGVGAKLKPAWLAKVLGEGAKSRPYMATRMPRFGDRHAAAMHSALLAADQRADAQPEPVLTERDAKFGWKLVGRDGLSCIACHTFTTYGSMGIPALSLDQMHERLQWDWFRRYLPDPAALRPGTRMPTFWPEGQAVNRDILHGDTGAQIQALWAYLAGGTKAEVPAGLIRGKQELVVDKEAVIYRNFIEGAGSRAIGVGYPERANLAFDANELRLALVWQGSFIDASRHSTDRGVGYEPPLGDHVLKLPPGPAFAVLDDSAAAWPAAPDRLAGVNRFLGYNLDREQRPTFRYRIGGVTVEELPQPRPGEVDMSLTRRFKLAGSEAGPLWFRAATGDIQPAGEGFTVDGKFKLIFRGVEEVKTVGNELRARVRTPGEFQVEMTW